MKTILLKIIIFIISIGWIIPIKISYTMFSSWAYNVAYQKNNEAMNSFPLHKASEEIGQFGFWWFSLVVIGWAAYFLFYKPYAEKSSSNAS